MAAKWCTLTPRVHARGVVVRILVLGKETHFFYCCAPSAQVWVPAQIWVPPCSLSWLPTVLAVISGHFDVWLAWTSTANLINGI